MPGSASISKTDAAEIPLRVVTRDEFEAIECNRCGSCCETFYPSTPNSNHYWWNFRGPLGFLELWCYKMAHDERDALVFHVPQIPDDPDPMFSAMMWFGQLTPTEVRVDGGFAWSYGCGFFTRDADGLGKCGMYETRPQMCAGFPYGEPKAIDGCSWNVDILDVDPRPLRDLRLPALDGSALAVVA